MDGVAAANERHFLPTGFNSRVVWTIPALLPAAHAEDLRRRRARGVQVYPRGGGPAPKAGVLNTANSGNSCLLPTAGSIHNGQRGACWIEINPRERCPGPKTGPREAVPIDNSRLLHSAGRTSLGPYGVCRIQPGHCPLSVCCRGEQSAPKHKYCRACGPSDGLSYFLHDGLLLTYRCFEILTQALRFLFAAQHPASKPATKSS